MANVRVALSAAMLLSGTVGILILLTDQYLWSAALSHAYGLVAFVAVDTIVALALWRKIWFGSLLSIGLAIVQGTAMLADVLTYSTPDVSQQAFRSYLLGNPAFVALLVIQPAILVLAVGATHVRTDYSIVRRWISTNLLH